METLTNRSKAVMLSFLLHLPGYFAIYLPNFPIIITLCSYFYILQHCKLDP